MVTGIQVGQKVRINEKYGKLKGTQENTVGTEFVVTDVTYATKPEDHESNQIVSGDPNGWGVWGDFVDVVPVNKGGTKTWHTKLSYHDADRTVRITSGTKAVSLAVNPNPAEYGNVDGSTSLTPGQAEEIAYELLARVAEIRKAEVQ